MLSPSCSPDATIGSRLPSRVNTALEPTITTPSVFKLNPTILPPTYTSGELINLTLTFLSGKKPNNLIRIVVAVTSSPFTAMVSAKPNLINGAKSLLSFANLISSVVTYILFG